LFAGKRVIVTGAASGIGLETARRFIIEGAAVLCADLEGDSLCRAQSVLESAADSGRAGAVSVCPVDVRKAASVDRMFDTAVAEFGGVDILVNSAGVNRVARIEGLTEDQWRQIIEVNLTGVFLCCKRAASLMVPQRSGKIINIASQSGKRGGIGLSAYCASKFGVIGFTQSLARELAEYGVTVNSVCPGVIHTVLWDKLAHEYVGIKGSSPEEVWHNVISGIPMGRAGTAEDVANVILFLASDQASFMTGQAINITGGSEMH
jgi:NAD(P)-dependent dehydrogenase (short-subunit alcohol dehydrogenase family)